MGVSDWGEYSMPKKTPVNYIPVGGLGNMMKDANRKHKNP